MIERQFATFKEELKFKKNPDGLLRKKEMLLKFDFSLDCCNKIYVTAVERLDIWNNLSWNNIL